MDSFAKGSIQIQHVASSTGGASSSIVFFAHFERVRDDGRKSLSKERQSWTAEVIFFGEARFESEKVLEKNKSSKKSRTGPGTTEGSREHMSGESLQDKELRFIREERRRLQELGITNYDDQSAEIAKRWAVIRQFVDDTSANVDAAQPTGFLSVDEPYSDKEADALGLILVDCDMSNTPFVRFIYKLASDASLDTSSVGAAAVGTSASAASSVRPKIVSGKCEYIDGPFKGSIEGYVYKMGVNGVGYYLDGKARVSHNSCPPVAPSNAKKRPRTDYFHAITAHLKLTTLEDMCVDLDFAKSGTKAEKISRIFWAFEHEGDIVSFLSLLRNETLRDILTDFSNKFSSVHIVFTGNKDELVRRIVQVSQLVS